MQNIGRNGLCIDAIKKSATLLPRYVGKMYVDPVTHNNFMVFVS